MFIGHFAMGLGAKKVAPEGNLGLYFVACQLLDLLWPLFAIVGMEGVRVDHDATVVTPLDFYHYPYSHSLIMSVVYGLILGGVVAYFLKSKKVGLVCGFLVLSHWILDFVTHRPDLPILFSGEKFGLGLWNSRPGTLFVEGGLFLLGAFLYWQVRRPLSRVKALWFFALIAFFIAIYMGNLFGPKPPLEAGVSMVAGPAFAMWIFVVWAYFVDRKPKISKS